MSGHSGHPPLELVIDQVELIGVPAWPAAAQQRLEAALGQELSRLIGEGGVPPRMLSQGGEGASPATSAAPDGGSISITGATTPEAVGLATARALYRSFQR